MGVFKTRTIYITQDKYECASDDIREQMDLNLADGGSNEDLINLAFDLQLIEMAHDEGVPVYDEDDMADTIARLVEVVGFDYDSVVLINLDDEEVVVDGNLREY
jgi:hypothetical protein